MADDTLVTPTDSSGSGPAGDGGTPDDAPRGDEHADGDGSPAPEGGTQPKPDGKTAKRVADTESALKARQAELTRISQELAAKQAALEVLNGQIKPKAQEEDEPQDWMEAEEETELRQRYEQDPLRFMLDAVKKERGLLSEVFGKQRDRDLLARVREIVTEATDPERSELRDVLGELQKTDGFSALPHKTQIAVARTVRDARGKKNDTLEPPGTGPAGTGRRAPATPPVDERKQRAERLATDKGIWGGRISDDEAAFPMGKPERRAS